MPAVAALDHEGFDIFEKGAVLINGNEGYFSMHGLGGLQNPSGSAQSVQLTALQIEFDYIDACGVDVVLATPAIKRADLDFFTSDDRVPPGARVSLLEIKQRIALGVDGQVCSPSRRNRLPLS